MARAATANKNKTATKTAAKQAPAPQVSNKPSDKVSPYKVFTLRNVPTIPEKKRRTEFGWEALDAPKKAMVVPWEKEPSARSSISAYAKGQRKPDGSGPQFTVYANRDKDGNVIPRMVNGMVVKDKRGNVKPGEYVVARGEDFPVGTKHDD